MVDLGNACFVFVDGKWTCPNRMPAVQTISCRLALLGLVSVGGKRAYLNGIPTFSRINVLQSSCDFVSILVIRLTVARYQGCLFVYWICSVVTS